MTKYATVEGKPGLYRDEDSNAVINRNTTAYNSYMARKKAMTSKNNELDKMKDYIEIQNILHLQPLP